MRRFFLMLMVSLTISMISQRVFALAFEEIGNEPLNELNYPDWKGIIPVINDQSRVYSIWVNGNESLYYSGSTDDLNQALVNFSKIEADTHYVVLSTDKGQRKTIRSKAEINFNWQLHVIGGIARTGVKENHDDLKWHKDPVLTIHVDEKIDLAKLKIPAGITLRMEKEKAADSQSTALQRTKLERIIEQHKSKQTNP